MNSQTLHREADGATLADGRGEAVVTRLGRGAIALIVTAGALVGAAGGWVGYTALSGPDPAAIQRARAEAQVHHYEQQWQARTRPQEIERLRAEALVEHHERLWRDRGVAGER
jgi:hypothetical protein